MSNQELYEFERFVAIEKARGNDVTRWETPGDGKYALFQVVAIVEGRKIATDRFVQVRLSDGMCTHFS